MHISDLDQIEVKPIGNLCCNCAFCRREFRGEGHYCMLRAAVKNDERFLSYIPCIWTTSCKCFSSQEPFMKMMNIKHYEEFEMLRTLGTFASLPDDVVIMRANWFLDQEDASDKQCNYAIYLAELNNITIPLKIEGHGYFMTINAVNDKKILRNWILSKIKDRVKTSML